MTNTIAALVLSVLVTNHQEFSESRPQWRTVYPETGEEVNPWVPHGWAIETVSSNLVAQIVFDGKTNETVLASRDLIRRELHWQLKTPAPTHEWTTNEWHLVHYDEHGTQYLTNEPGICTNTTVISK